MGTLDTWNNASLGEQHYRHEQVPSLDTGSIRQEQPQTAEQALLRAREEFERRG